MEYLAGKKKSFKKTIGIIFLLILTIVLVGVYQIRKTLPPMDGELPISNLQNKVSVIRDQYGIPHIKAKSRKDAFLALGYIIASERLFQMEMQRRLANGELSEVIGDKTLASDKLFRTLGIRQSMSDMLEQKIKNHTLDPEMMEEIKAFYDGVNQFQENGKLPIEFAILGIKPRPFSVLDGYTFIGLMSFSFGIGTSQEPLMSSLRARLGVELSNELRNEITPAEKKLEEKDKGAAIKSRRVVDNLMRFPVSSIISDLENGFQLFEGSNGWLISGKRSKSGFPILANDPHITFSHPGVWFEAHISTPDYESYGHFLSVIPFPILSHNKERGWGLTMSLVDDMDLYREKLDPKFKTYAFKGQNISYRERLEIIKIKKKPDLKMVIIETQHGPILDEIFPHPEDKSIALKWAFRSPLNDPLTALYKMGKAKSMEEFKTAVALGHAPGLNILYADKKNIAWWIFGDIAKKSTHTPTDFILDGASGLDEYLGSYTFDQKPHLENPENGIIVSANARPVGVPAIADDLRGDWQPDDRYKTIEALLTQKELWSVPEIEQIQTLSLNLENKLILNALLKDIDFQNLWKKGRAKTYIEILKNWDFISDVHTIAPSLYYTWNREIVKILLKDLSSEEFQAFSKLPNYWNFFKRLVLNPESVWWKKFNRKKVFTEAFNNSIETLRQQLGEEPKTWAWGHLHTIEFTHPIGRIKPLNLIFNVGPIELSGAANEINNQKQSGTEDGFKVKAGPSTRRIIDFSHPEKALGVLPVGNSGHIFSPFYKDQLDLYIKGNYREEWLDEVEIKKHQTHELELVPAK